MRNRSAALVLATLIGCVYGGACRADGVTELATLKGNGAPANWIALSADGTRLAVARKTELATLKANVKGKTGRIPAEFEIWDVDSGTKICTGKNAKADFTCVMLSANGKTLITVDEGFNNAGGNVAVKGGLRTRGKSGYQAWDSTTGREISSAIVPAGHGEFTTAAVSPDGKYLATVYNEQITGAKSQPTKPFGVREVTVWDLNAHKAGWKLKSSSHTGRVIWSDSLAFYLTGSGGPLSEAASAPAGRRPEVIDPLRLLTLEAGNETPTVAVLARPNAKSGSIEWLSSGEFLFVREGRAIEALDPSTGRSKGSFALTFPHPAPPKPSGKAFPLPHGRPNNTNLPDNWYDPQTAPSADGSRFAASFYHLVEEKQLREIGSSSGTCPAGTCSARSSCLTMSGSLGPIGSRPKIWAASHCRATEGGSR